MAIFKPADILIPQNVDFTKWSVVACDQYTSEREYWEDVKNIVGDSPSTLNIIFPEVYLEDGDGDERIKKINSTMEEYINKGIFRKLKDTFIYVKRTQPNGKTRHGIVGMLDLEEYDFSKGSQSKVRATEGTIIERIPPRQRIRKNAPLEAPHILILIDDREKAVVEPLENQINDFEKIYDFDLMKTHPARFALVELMNIHDETLEFEPIQRVIFETDPKKLLDELVAFYGAEYEDNGGQRIDYTYGGNEGSIYIKNTDSNLPVGTLQKFLDKYLTENGGKIDYIHGNDVVRNLAKADNTIGFMVDSMEKNDLFTTVIKDGSLPRKTFSMGEAADKRFYLECKKIR